MKKLLVLVVLLWATVLHAQITYWWSQMLKKPDAKQSQEYFFVAGTNIYFTYATNRVIINGTGTNGASPMPPGASFWFADNTNIFWTNPPPAEVWIGDGTGNKKIQLRADGTSTFESNLVCKTTISTKDFTASGTIVGGPGAVFYGNGAGLTNIPCCTNGAFVGTFSGTFYGNGDNITNLTGNAIYFNYDPTLNVGSAAQEGVVYVNDATGNPAITLSGLDGSLTGTNFVALPGGGFFGDGSGLTNVPCCTNGAYSGSFTGDGSGLTNLNVQAQTNISYTAVTNAPWLTNVTLANLPSGVLTNNWNGPTVIITNSSLVVTGATGTYFAVSNGASRVLIGNNGTITTSGTITSGGTISATTGNDINAGVGGVFGLGSLGNQRANIGSTVGNTIQLLGPNSNFGITNLAFGKQSTNVSLQFDNATVPTMSVVAASGSGGANVAVSGNVSATNGFLIQVKPQFTTNFTCTTNLQTYICNGTNQVITLPTGSAINDIVYRFSCTNGWGKFIISNGIAGGTIRDGFSPTFTQIGIGSPSFFTHDGGTNWTSAARTRVVFPNAQFSCSTNIPLVLANTAYPVTLNSTDFNSSQGIALLAGTNGLASKMWITNAGQYEFTPSIVFTNGNVSHIVRYWFRSNDTNIPNSCTPTKFSGNDTYVVTVPFLINITQPTAIEIWAESTGTGEQLCALPASGNFPATPSVIIPVKRISDPWP